MNLLGSVCIVAQGMLTPDGEAHACEIFLHRDRYSLQPSPKPFESVFQVVEISFGADTTGADAAHQSRTHEPGNGTAK